MWEAISNVFTSGNAIPVGIMIGVFVLFIAFLARKGLFSFYAKGVSLGNGDKERNIIRHQIDYVESHCTDFFTRVKKTEKFNDWEGKYITEKVFDVFVRIISYNHINVEDTYVDLRQSEVWKVIQEHLTADDSEYYSSKEFKEIIYKEVKDIIEKLVKIREFYSR